MSLIRLQKALAEAGFSSRREAEDIISEGRVVLNGKPVTQQGIKIDPLRDQVSVDGKPIRLFAPGDQLKVYFVLNKPGNVLTTTKDDRGRQTVIDLIRGLEDTRVFPVGRLDYDAEGALLLTNDGELANRLTHPRFHIPKTYMAKVKGVPAEDKLDKLRKGIYLEDGPTQPAHIDVLNQVKKNTWVEIIMTEGRNRQVKRMFWRIKHPVIKLVRTHFANLSIDGLKPGQFRDLTKKELAQLRAMTH